MHFLSFKLTCFTLFSYFLYQSPRRHFDLYHSYTLLDLFHSCTNIPNVSGTQCLLQDDVSALPVSATKYDAFFRKTFRQLKTLPSSGRCRCVEARRIGGVEAGCRVVVAGCWGRGGSRADQTKPITTFVIK